ncbi:hypothetical protein IWQ61_004562 [Dispira simplex]|nr:hypothetical protein IWQ61_004562 [Dispira simplex]
MSLISYTESEFDPRDTTWDDWENEEEPQLYCLFCTNVYPDASTLFRHCKSAHGFDFVTVKTEQRLSFYQCVRLINYIRTQVKAQGDAFDPAGFTVGPDDTYLEDDLYLRPVLENDELLMCFDDVELEALDNSTAVPHLEGYPEPTTELEVALMKRVQDLQFQLGQAQSAAAFISSQFEHYKEQVKTHFYDALDDETRTILSQAMSLSLKPRPSHAKLGQKDPSDYYFQSYANNDIHETMLKDRVRTEGYRDFIYDNKDLFKGKVVLDVGCGTGILSMFAARAGAKQVIAVDNSDIIDKTHQTIVENRLDGVITLIKGKIEEIELPVPYVDIIISEWMGYFLLFEAMLDSVLVARDKWLVPDGLLCPSHTRILLTGFQDDELFNDTLNFWNNVYGFSMNAMKAGFYDEPLVDIVPARAVNTTLQCLKTIDISYVEKPSLDFVSVIELTITQSGKFHGFLGYFDTFFARQADVEPPEDDPKALVPYAQADQDSSSKSTTLPNPNAPAGVEDTRVHRFTTGPHGKPTHWKQTLFALKEPFAVEKGDAIIGQFTCHKNKSNSRNLDITIQYRHIPAGGSWQPLVQGLHSQKFYLH